MARVLVAAAACALVLLAGEASAARVRLGLGRDPARRQLLQEETEAHSGSHGVTVGDRHYLDLNATQIRGVYEAQGQNYPENIWSSFFTEEFPDCNANTTVVNWEHFGPTDVPMVAISAHSEDAGSYVEAHHRGTYGARILEFANSTLQLVELSEGEKYCVHWQPFVNVHTGELLINSVTLAMWTKDAAGANNYTDLTCDYVAGNEKPGCYLGDVARYDSTPDVEARAAEIEASPVFQNRPAGSVISAAVATYICRNGECGASSPKYARIDAEHED